jgi:hypothetical protein
MKSLNSVQSRSMLKHTTSTSLASKDVPIAWQRAASRDPVSGTPLMFRDATVAGGGSGPGRG